MKNIVQYLDAVNKNYFKLLVIPDDVKEKSEIIAFLKKSGWTSIDVTNEVLRIAEGVSEEKKRLRVPMELEKWLNNIVTDKCIFENISILFSPELGKIDPIRLFKYGYARERNAIVIFPGRIRGDKAEYSLEGKEDHMIMDVSEVVCYSGKGAK
ncbi:MAG: BREX-3 system P-loop-containing protein BrxF [Candidatus Bathyarchaeota archaeon]|nr:MAG: BREX-3 system P-loop-containing protein BrxF [Candidatus Bathyarchaeota archaeon]